MAAPSTEHGPAAPAGWYPDPTGRYEVRWWDGERWAAEAASKGETYIDPYEHRAEQVPHPAPEGVEQSAAPTSVVAPPDAAARRRRVPASVLAAALAVLALVAGIVVATRDDGGSGAAGGRLVATLPSGAEATLDVPEGAVPDGVEVTFEALAAEPADLGDLAAGDEGVWVALADFALDEDTLLHPVYGPIVAAAAATAVGPELVFGPDGLELAGPAVLTVPLGDVGLDPDEEAFFLLESGDGWDVLDPAAIDHAAGTLTVEVPHFSRGRIWQILGNMIGNPTASPTREEYRAALDTLANGPAQDVSDSVARAALCASLTGTAGVNGFDASNVPSGTDLLSYLASDGERVANLPAGANRRIRDTLMAHFLASRAAGNPTPHDITMEQLVGMAMAETGGDVFQALVLTHDVLRDNRESQPVQGVLEIVRGDNRDEEGARYHLIGMAVYSFAYEHLRTSGQTNLVWPPSPEFAASYEEAWVSGDIHTDTVEYALDRLGARLGRDLYRDLRRAQEDGASALEDLCRSTTTTSSSTTSPATTSTLPTDLDLGSGDVQVTLQWSGDADMDLHVTDPSGEEIYFGHRSSASGGQLDHDDIPACDDTDAHAENIFWPEGEAPAGDYAAWVRNYRACGEGEVQTAQLSIRVDGRVVHTEVVALAGRTDSAPFEFTVR